MDTATIISSLDALNATSIITTLETLEESGFNLTSIDIPTVLASFNVTQIEGLLESNSTVVNGLLQSLTPVQLVEIIDNFQNVTSTLFNAALTANSTEVGTAYLTTGKTLITLLLEKIQTTFTDSQLLGVFTILSNGAALGTGAKKLVKIAKQLIYGFFGDYPVDSNDVEIPSRLISLVEEYQSAIFGGYPTHRDIAPSSIFMAIFFFFTIIHTSLYFKNRSLGHYFPISLGLSFYSICRTLGFLLRIVWSTNILKLDVGITSTIFIVIPTTMLPSLNLILAQRYFTWKHPVYGSLKMFQILMYVIYAAVIIVIVMTIIAAAVQIDYFLGSSHFKMTRNVIEASSILIIIYSLIALILVSVSFIIPPTSNDKKFVTYQPTWIKSFKWNYFVEKGAAQREAELVTDEQKDAIRVINSSSYHHETINQDSNEETNDEMNHSNSILIIALSTLALIIADMFRCVSTFIHQYEFASSWIFDPVVMYVMFGVLETFVNLLFIFGRIDLRFYKPDAFKNVPALKPEETAQSEETEDKANETA